MNIEAEIQTIKDRNVRVEADKAWERSWLRIGSIVIATYIIAALVLVVIHNDNPFRNALIPAIGYFLSTLSLPFLKQSWIKSYLKK
jgi:hypothetical protein